MWSEYGSFKILTVMCLGALFELYETSVGARGKNNNAIIILRRRNWEKRRREMLVFFPIMWVQTPVLENNWTHIKKRNCWLSRERFFSRAQKGDKCEGLFQLMGKTGVFPLFANLLHPFHWIRAQWVRKCIILYRVNLAWTNLIAFYLTKITKPSEMKWKQQM